MPRTPTGTQAWQQQQQHEIEIMSLSQRLGIPSAENSVAADSTYTGASFNDTEVHHTPFTQCFALSHTPALVAHVLSPSLPLSLSLSLSLSRALLSFPHIWTLRTPI